MDRYGVIRTCPFGIIRDIWRNGRECLFEETKMVVLLVEPDRKMVGFPQKIEYNTSMRKCPEYKAKSDERKWKKRCGYGK